VTKDKINLSQIDEYFIPLYLLFVMISTNPRVAN